MASGDAPQPYVSVELHRLRDRAVGLAEGTFGGVGALRERPRERLDDNDGHGFFEALGDSVVTGPTLTNVNDFRAIVVDGSSSGDR